MLHSASTIAFSAVPAAAVSTTAAARRSRPHPPPSSALAGQSDDECNEFELPLGNLIIDLDADIEKSDHSRHSGTVSPVLSHSPPAAAGPLAMSKPAEPILLPKLPPIGVSLGALSMPTLPSAGTAAAQLHSPNSDPVVRGKLKRKQPAGRSAESKLEAVAADPAAMAMEQHPPVAAGYGLQLPQPALSQPNVRPEDQSATVTPSKRCKVAAAKKERKQSTKASDRTPAAKATANAKPTGGAPAENGSSAAAGVKSIDSAPPAPSPQPSAAKRVRLDSVSGSRLFRLFSLACLVCFLPMI